MFFHFRVLALLAAVSAECPQLPLPTANEFSVNVADLACEFQTDLCGWDAGSGAQFLDATRATAAWARITGPTRTRNTGPSADAGLDGFYVYAESSLPNHPFVTFALTSPFFFAAPGSKLTFSYNLFGASTGPLTVDVLLSGDDAWTCDVWTTVDASSEDVWLQAPALSLDSVSRVRLRYTTGVGPTGDAGIDSITLRDIPTAQPTSARPTTLPPTASPTAQPTVVTSAWPTTRPTRQPTVFVVATSAGPTQLPTVVVASTDGPTPRPSDDVTLAAPPTRPPSSRPTDAPTLPPTLAPTRAPVSTPAYTTKPTPRPTRRGETLQPSFEEDRVTATPTLLESSSSSKSEIAAPVVVYAAYGVCAVVFIGCFLAIFAILCRARRQGAAEDAALDLAEAQQKKRVKVVDATVDTPPGTPRASPKYTGPKPPQYSGRKPVGGYREEAKIELPTPPSWPSAPPLPPPSWAATSGVARVAAPSHAPPLPPSSWTTTTTTNAARVAAPSHKGMDEEEDDEVIHVEDDDLSVDTMAFMQPPVAMRGISSMTMEDSGGEEEAGGGEEASDDEPLIHVDNNNNADDSASSSASSRRRERRRRSYVDDDEHDDGEPNDEELLDWVRSASTKPDHESDSDDDASQAPSADTTTSRYDRGARYHDDDDDDDESVISPQRRRR